MQRKKRFRWIGKAERSVAEIITEDGVMRQKDVVYVIEKLCSLLEDVSGKESEEKVFIHPKNVIVSVFGDVRMEKKELPLSAMESYLSPELSQTDFSASDARVYALGMLMLYMTTGKETKEEINAESVSRPLLSLIKRCTAFDPKERFRDSAELLAAIRYETGTEKNTRIVVAGLLITGIAFSLVFFFGRAGMQKGKEIGDRSGYRSGFSEGFEQGFSDVPGLGMTGAFPDVHSGNLSGNFTVEEGPFAVHGEGDVYYLTRANLCHMDSYTKETEAMVAVSDAYALQYYNGSLYYCNKEYLYRLDLKTEETRVICESDGMRFYIYNDTFYLYDRDKTGYLYRVDPEKGTLIQMNGAASYRCLNIVDGQLYYISPDSTNCLCRSDLDGGNQSVISSGIYESMCVYGGSIYAASSDGMIRMDLNGGNPESILSCTVYSLNVSDGGIYYTSGSGRTLEWMSLDGKIRYTVVNTRTGSFNVAGRWIFYRNEDDEGRLWRVRIGGSDNARVTQ